MYKNAAIAVSTTALLLVAIGCCCSGEGLEEVSSIDNEEGAHGHNDSEGTGESDEEDSGPSIRDVDFKNFTYTHADLGTFTAKNGEYERPSAEDDFVETFSVVKVEFGNVDGKSGDEALVMHVYGGGGTGQFDQIDVYAMKSGKAKVVASIPGGDRGDGGLNGFSIKGGGTVIVERLNSTEEDGACCPSQIMVETWNLKGGKMVQDKSKTETKPFSE